MDQSGWGVTEVGGDDSNVLLEVNVTVVSNKECRNDYKTNSLNLTITDNMICANVAGGGKDSCQGDSGGI